MKVIVAGGRDFTDYKLTCKVLSKLKHPFELVCGEARGADNLGKRYAVENNLKIHSFPADWNRFGKSAGYIRNKQMAKFAEGLIAFWDGKSKGTKHMIDLAKQYGLKILVIKY